MVSVLERVDCIYLEKFIFTASIILFTSLFIKFYLFQSETIVDSVTFIEKEKNNFSRYF